MKECSECGTPFECVYKNVFCCSPECSTIRHRRVAKAWKQAAYAANPQKFIDRVAKTKERPCVKCGCITYSNKPKEGFICYECSRLASIQSCIECGQPTATSRKYCDDCFGCVKAMAFRLGLTPSWMSRLISPWIKQGLSRKEALQRVYKDRTSFGKAA